MAARTPDTAIRRFGAFEINFQSGELRKSGMRLRLSGQPFQVLAVLVERAGELVTREELNSKLWPAETFVDFDHGLNNAVARIREVLDDSAGSPMYVETIPRRGYRFIAPVTGGRPVEVLVLAEPEVSPPPNVIGAGTIPPSNAVTRKTFASSHMRLLVAGAIGMAVLAVAFPRYHSTETTARSRDIRSLAVLPLKNLSGDQSPEYLADGMTEELIERLAGTRDLRVISRTSVTRFKETKLSAPEIAKVLQVDAFVEGSIVRQGSRIRIHAQLIRAATDEHFRSATYDREIGDVLALES